MINRFYMLLLCRTIEHKLGRLMFIQRLYFFQQRLKILLIIEVDIVGGLENGGQEPAGPMSHIFEVI